jgi:hypothetical protein
VNQEDSHKSSPDGAARRGRREDDRALATQHAGGSNESGPRRAARAFKKRNSVALETGRTTGLALFEVGHLPSCALSAGKVVVVAQFPQVAGREARRKVEMVEERRAAGHTIRGGGTSAGQAGLVAGQTDRRVCV